MQQGHAGGFVDAAALGFDDAVFDLVAHAQAVAAADAVQLQEDFHGIGVFLAVDGHGAAFFEGDRDFFGLDFDLGLPESHTHDGVHDADAGVQEFQILGFVGGAQHIGIGGIGLLGRHLVAETFLGHEGRHFCTAAQLVDKVAVQPGLVDLQRGVGEQTVAVEALDVVALEGGAVTPDVDVVFLHCGHQHGAGHGAAQGRGVEVGDAAGGDVEGAGLDGGNAFVGQLGTAVDQTRLFCAIFHRLAGDFVVVGFVGLAQVGRVGVGQGTLVLHPAQGGRGVQAAGEGDADLLADGNMLQNGFHEISLQSDSCKRLTGKRLGLKRLEILGSGPKPGQARITRSGRCSDKPRSRGCRTWSSRGSGSSRQPRTSSIRRCHRACIRRSRPRIP